MHIIAPARSITMLSRVIKAGADMVYVGLKGYCRKEKESIDLDTLTTFCKIAEDNNVRVIVAFNKLPRIGLTWKFIRGVEKALSAGANGIILNDTGLINLIRKKYPHLYIMASIGMSPLNWREVRFIADSGASTVLLSEFLELDEIREIKDKCDVGLELFAMGLREFGYTGKCILSSYHRQIYRDNLIVGSAKRGGTCSDICRTGFRLYGRRKTEVGGQRSEVRGQICRRDVLIPINGGRMPEDGDRITDTDSRQDSNEINLRFQPFSVLERDLNLTGETQFFHTNDKLRDLLPYIDIFKIWQGFLKDEELYGIIEAMREMRNGK
ncbi:MAG: U32 family peptidase [Candidatus Eremiobacteraeota bacterium]|nr:U32 family peptidase [Candidatus Eremiobacteraeota bacterium]